MLRFFLFISIAMLIITPLYLLCIPLALWYMFLFTGYELILLAVLIDGYFGAFYTVPVISILSIIMVFSVDLLKPTLLMYTKKDEILS